MGIMVFWKNAKDILQWFSIICLLLVRSTFYSPAYKMHQSDLGLLCCHASHVNDTYFIGGGARIIQNNLTVTYVCVCASVNVCFFLILGFTS